MDIGASRRILARAYRGYLSTASASSLTVDVLGS